MMNESTDMLTDYTLEQRRRIAGIARLAVTDAVMGFEPQDPGVLAEETYLHDFRGCFVSLHDIYDRLRGCIGTFEADRELWRNLQHMGAAATRDPRFVHSNPVHRGELSNLVVEVSVLTPMTLIEDPASLRVGVDGIYIKALHGGRPVSGCYLPQVATDQGWGVEQFITSCWSHKMGMPGSWRDARDAQFHVFQSIIISESDAHE